MAKQFIYLGQNEGIAAGAGGTVKVYAPPNIPVTIKNNTNTKTITKNSGPNGLAIFKDLEEDIWIVSIVYNGKTITRNIHVSLDSSIYFNFEYPLYDNGNIEVQHSMLNGTATNDTTNGWLLISGGTGAIVYYNVDLTDYSTLKISYKDLNSQNTNVRVFTHTSNSYNANNTVATLGLNDTTEGTLSLDISALSGTYGIRVACYKKTGTASMKMQKLWLVR